MATLSDVADILGGFAFKSRDMGSEGYPVIKIADITPPVVTTRSAQRVRPEQVVGLDKYRLRNRDILMAMTGATTGKVGRLRSDETAYLNQRVAKISAKGGADFDDFVYAIVSQPRFDEQVLKNASGSAQPNVSAEGIGRIEIPDFPFSEQLRIGRIIGALDDKIELNRKMSATLEAMARAMFKSWFVDFDPVRAKAEGRDPGLLPEIAALFPDSFEDSELGEIPRGWSIEQIATIADVSRNGINPAHYPDEVFHHYSIPAFDAGRLPVAETGTAIKSNKFVVLDDSVLVSRLNPRTPRVWRVDLSRTHRSICSTEFAVVRPRALPREWLYCLFSNSDFSSALATMVTGTSGSHQRVKPESLLAMQVVAPSAMVSDHFVRVVAPVLARATHCLKESQNLAAIRDVLLPKLISGELRVNAANGPVERFA